MDFSLNVEAIILDILGQELLTARCRVVFPFSCKIQFIRSTTPNYCLLFVTLNMADGFTNLIPRDRTRSLSVCLESLSKYSLTSPCVDPGLTSCSRAEAMALRLIASSALSRENLSCVVLEKTAVINCPYFLLGK